MSTLFLAPAAFLAGVLMFLAPCTLPIVPGYLAFIAGVPDAAIVNETTRRAARRQVFLNALAFVCGFSVVFILLGTFAGFIGSHLGPWRYLLSRLAGLMLIFFGLILLGLGSRFMQGEWHARIPSSLRLGTPHSSFLIGALFALGWSPCIGPILGSILFLASASATALQGAILLAVFSLGLSLPFLLVALLINEASRHVVRIAVLAQILERVGGVVLIIVGVLITFGWMGGVVSNLYALFDSLGYSKLLNYL